MKFAVGVNLNTLYRQVNKNILSERVGGILVLQANSILHGVKSKETSFIRRENVIVLYLAHFD